MLKPYLIWYPMATMQGMSGVDIKEVVYELSGLLSLWVNKVYQVTAKGDSVIRYFDRAKGLIEVDEPSFNPLQIARGR